LNQLGLNLDSSLEPRLGQVDSILYEIENFTSDLEIVTGGFDSFASSATSLDSSMKVLQSLVNEMNEGKGTLGKFLKDDSLYDNLNDVVENTNSLIDEVKKDPRSNTNINLFLGGK
jgi:phospholipid/cholesterol/gamma-HCH transport system substrate-binding protein